MAKGQFPVEKLQLIETPFYYYDAELLRETLRSINAEAQKHEGFVVHYAVKANANPRVLRIIREAGLGADCVSGGEIDTERTSAVLLDEFRAAKIGRITLDRIENNGGTSDV